MLCVECSVCAWSVCARGSWSLCKLEGGGRGWLWQREDVASHLDQPSRLHLTKAEVQSRTRCPEMSNRAASISDRASGTQNAAVTHGEHQIFLWSGNGGRAGRLLPQIQRIKACWVIGENSGSCEEVERKEKR